MRAIKNLPGDSFSQRRISCSRHQRGSIPCRASCPRNLCSLTAKTTASPFCCSGSCLSAGYYQQRQYLPFMNAGTAEASNAWISNHDFLSDWMASAGLSLPTGHNNTSPSLQEAQFDDTSRATPSFRHHHSSNRYDSLTPRNCYIQAIATRYRQAL